jgi:probable HAF family extracellular repeat protein
MNSSSAARCAVTSAWILASAGAWANSYALMDLGPRIVPVGIDDRNEIVALDRAHHARIAVVFRDGRWHELDKPHEPIVPAGIDRRGDVAGSGSDGRPALWTRGLEYHAVDAPADAVASALSNDRTIAGSYVTRSGTHRCYRTPWQQPAADIGLPDARATDCEPVAVNEAGWIAGWVATPAGSELISRAWIWRDGVFQDLGSLSHRHVNARATSMNRTGQVVGDSETDALLERAFLWDGTQMLDIGESAHFPSTVAASISNRGEIVGAGLDPEGHQHALRFADGAVIDLADEVAHLDGMALLEAVSVNDDGVIIGIASLDGETHGFALVPR